MENKKGLWDDIDAHNKKVAQQQAFVNGISGLASIIFLPVLFIISLIVALGTKKSK